MNEYKFEDIKLNMTEEFTVEITKKMKEDFKANIGDINPIHSDKEFAEKKGFNDILVFGMLTASFYSKLVGVYLPGRNALFQECKDLMFHSPVFIGDILNIKGEVISIDDRFKRITIKAVIRNQHNKKVCSAKLIVGVI